MGHDDVFEFQCSVYDLHNPREHDINKHNIIDLASSVDNIVNRRTDYDILIADDDCRSRHHLSQYVQLYYCPLCDVYDLIHGGDDVSG